MAVLRSTLLALGLALSGASAEAHDFWIRPASFAPRSGERVALDLCVGADLAGDRLPRSEAKLLRFFALDPKGEAQDVLGLDGRAPAGWLRPGAEGTWWVGYESRATAIELEAAKFESYLVEEGLESVSAERRRRGQGALAGREQYSRSVKSLLVCGTGAAREFGRELGLPLELLLRSDPAALARGSELEFELHFQGRALAGALVGLQHEGAPEPPRRRTDEHGRVRFALREPGVHLARVVHMLPAEPGSGADWRSYWSSLSFAYSPASSPSGAK